jgi:hypothetical protein
MFRLPAPDLHRAGDLTALYVPEVTDESDKARTLELDSSLD